MRYRLSLADVGELLAERGVHVHRSTIYLWVQWFTPLYQEAARPHRRPPGGVWHTDETQVKVAGAWRYVYRAIDEGEPGDAMPTAPPPSCSRRWRALMSARGR